MDVHNENEAYVDLLCVHLQAIVRRLRQIPHDRWDWRPDVMAPTARILTQHAWQWLVSDRQTIYEPDASKHPRIPEPPADPEAMIAVLVEETENWRRMLLSLTREQLDEPRMLFNGPKPKSTLRGLVCHMIQNTIYKHGQLSMLYFLLGLDGPDPYAAPLPNEDYEVAFGPES